MNFSKEISNVTDIRDAFAVCSLFVWSFRFPYLCCFPVLVWISFQRAFVQFGSVHFIAVPNFKITLWHCVFCVCCTPHVQCPKYKMWLTLTFKEHIKHTSCSWRDRWFFDIILCNVAFLFEKCYVCLFSCWCFSSIRCIWFNYHFAILHFAVFADSFLLHEIGEKRKNNHWI